MTNKVLTLAQQLDKFQRALAEIWKNEKESKSKRRKIMALQRAIRDTHLMIANRGDDAPAPYAGKDIHE